MITNWRKFDSQFLMVILRRLCVTDERFIRSLLQSTDEDIVQGSFHRPITVVVGDIKAVMTAGMIHSCTSTWHKFTKMFQSRDDMIAAALLKGTPSRQWQTSKYMYLEGNPFDSLVKAMQHELEVSLI